MQMLTFLHYRPREKIHNLIQPYRDCPHPVGLGYTSNARNVDEGSIGNWLVTVHRSFGNTSLNEVKGIQHALLEAYDFQCNCV